MTNCNLNHSEARSTTRLRRDGPQRSTVHSEAGFSLVELMIVISIIAIISVAGVVGFRGSSDTLVVKQVKGIIEDTVKIVELEIQGEEYEKSTIHFLPNYLVIVSEPEDTTLSLSLGDTSSCSNGNNIEIGDNGSLIKRDSESSPIETVNVTDGDSVCIDFMNSMETEIRYQVASGGEKSPIVRFIHFDVKREKPSGVYLQGDSASAGDDINSTIQISAPYAKKSIATSDNQIDLIVKLEDAVETLTIK